ncbi:tRNA lysidine(34) synthetase TilS [soil metagenome]
MTDKQSSTVVEVFERALGKIRTRVCVSASGEAAASPIAIAYSGGLDSTVLLDLASAYAQVHCLVLFAFHIHHGISPNADAWLAHCRMQCERRGIAFDSRHVDISNQAKSGVEEAARLSRYAALGDLCRTHQIPLLLTAHHLDDQAETVLLQLLRGSGVAGLSGMDVANTAPDLLGDPLLLVGRPLLAVSRGELESFVRNHELMHIEDESNVDPRYARNALRHRIMPAIAQSFPGFQDRFARSAAHAQSAQRLLVELGAQDLATCLDGECLNIMQLRVLSADRIDNLLRYWFGSRGIRMPSTAWLNELRVQLLEAKPDAQLCVTHADCHVRRHRDRVFITARTAADEIEPEATRFQWNGETEISFPEFGGVLYFEAAERGLDAEWLRRQELSIALRSGGERLKPAANRPTKSLKYHYQALDIPAWERTRLPVVSSGKQLLFAAGIGMDSHQMSDGPDARISFRWQREVR